jgi:hypothetical protein
MELEAVYLAAPSVEVYNECIRSQSVFTKHVYKVSLRQSTSVLPYQYFPPKLCPHSLVCH